MSIEDRLRKYIAGLRKGHGPHISRYVVIETLNNIILEGEREHDRNQMEE